MKNFITKAPIVITGLIIAFSLAECFLRLIDWPKDPGFVAGWRYDMKKDKNANQLGFRGRKIEYADRNIIVLLLGDSHVEATNLDFNCLPEQILEQYLRSLNLDVKVFSAEAGGYGNDQELLVLKEYFQKYRADYVILWQSLENDVWDNIFPTHWPNMIYNAKPTFWLENGVLKGPNYQMGERIFKQSNFKLNSLYQRFILFGIGLDRIWETKLPQAYKPLVNYSGIFFTDWDYKKNKKQPLLKYENFNTEKSHLATFLYPRSKRTQYGLDLTRKLLGEIDKLCKKNNSEFFIFYFSPIFPKDKEDGIRVQKINNLFYIESEAQYKKNEEYVNEGFRVLEVPLETQNATVSGSDKHLNCKANTQVLRSLGELLVDYIRKKR